jgi:hypothetical protein
MGKLWIGLLAFAGGVGVGLVIAKLYARAQVSSGIHAGLDKLGLAGGDVETIVQGLGAQVVN